MNVEVGIDTTASEQIQVQKVNTSSFQWEAIPFQIKYNILPATGWTPDNVILQILNSSNQVIYSTSNLPKQAGENQTTTWDGENSGGNLVDYGDYKTKIVVEENGTSCESNVHGFTVYMVRLGNCVYRDLSNELNEHAGLLYSYMGQNIRGQLDNHSKYLVIEHPGGSGTTNATYLSDFMAVDDYHGEWCPTNLTKSQRLQVLSTARTLYGEHHPYVTGWPPLHILQYDGTEWEGTIDNIARLRCDGVTEVSYEENGILLWGSNLMSSQTNLNQHYNPNALYLSGCTPQRQRFKNSKN